MFMSPSFRHTGGSSFSLAKGTPLGNMTNFSIVKLGIGWLRRRWPRSINRFLVFLPFLASSVCGQAPHPRIWLDSTRMSRLTALKDANDPTWLALKTDADSYLAASVPAYDRNACAANQICYSYQGSGWYDALSKLSLAYKLTGNSAYANKVKQIVAVMVKADVGPIQVDSRFPTRFIALGLALAYDWCYDQLSSTDKANWTALADVYWNDVNARGYQWNVSSGAGPNGYGNYFGGHLLGMGTLALAIEGDDLNAATMQTAVLDNFNTYVVGAFAAGFRGGYAVESYNYGGSHFIRLFQYMDAMRTAGKIDLLTSNIMWLKQVAKNTIYEVRPDQWSVTDEGGWTGSYVRTLYRNFPYDLAGLLNGTTEGGWLVHLYKDMAIPSNTAPAPVYMPTSFELFIYNISEPAVDYTVTEPPNLFSPGDQHTIARTDWSTSAVHTTFNGGTMVYADHQSHSAGHISVQRGSDYLLINAGEWAGQTGNVGNPQADDISNWHKNTLFYWDQSTNCLDQASNGGQYAGCQMFWSKINTTRHREGPGFAFQEADLRPAYLNNHNLTTITAYSRSFLSISDVDFVLDRISSPSTSIRNLEWHTPALRTASPAGIAETISVNGAVSSVVVGASKMWIKTLLPAPSLTTTVTDTISWSVDTPMSTQRFEVSDPNASRCSSSCLFLTVLAPTASTVKEMPVTTLITAPGYQGAIYDDGLLPRIAMFSVDGTALTTLTYAAPYSPRLVGTHVILDLTPGTYEVAEDGVVIYSGETVGADGCLTFKASGGSAFVIRKSGDVVLLPPTGLKYTTY